ncbi:hypothetical protein OIU74_009860 [Salix koriyanagi]|uniref:Uncharacterized protein n=1 Tax=Salix koriyanagi TaxID=2511006 RepID=A0A9Q0TCE4_9ROSI|nr:hypothetical protein OIU74_009860 [Salix koriyanagi]
MKIRLRPLSPPKGIKAYPNRISQHLSLPVKPPPLPSASLPLSPGKEKPTMLLLPQPLPNRFPSIPITSPIFHHHHHLILQPHLSATRTTTALTATNLTDSSLPYSKRQHGISQNDGEDNNYYYYADDDDDDDILPLQRRRYDFTPLISYLSNKISISSRIGLRLSLSYCIRLHRVPTRRVIPCSPWSTLAHPIKISLHFLSLFLSLTLSFFGFKSITSVSLSSCSTLF